MSPRAKRNLKISLLVLAVLIGVPLVYGGISLARNAPIEERAELANGDAAVVKDGFVVVSFLDLGDGHVALIDCGGDKDGKALLAELSRRKLGPEDVSAVLITHGHGDHFAACWLFPKAELLALAPDVPLVEGREAPKSLVGRMMGAKQTGLKVTRVIEPGEMTLGKKKIRVFAIPGHTSGSAAYLFEGVLFLGDSAGVLKSGELSETPSVFSDDAEAIRGSIRKMISEIRASGAAVDWVVPSHAGKVKGLDALSRFAGE